MPRCRLLALPLTSQIQVQKDEPSDRPTSCYVQCSMVSISRWIVEYGGSQSLSVHVSSLDHKTKDSYCNRQKAIISFLSMYQMQVRTLCFVLSTLGSIPRTCKTTPWSDALFPGRCSHSVDPSDSATSDKTTSVDRISLDGYAKRRKKKRKKEKEGKKQRSKTEKRTRQCYQRILMAESIEYLRCSGR